MVLAPSLPIQCKQIHEAPSVLSPVQIKSTGMRRGRGGRGVLAWSTQYSSAVYLPLNPSCNKNLCVIFDSRAYAPVFGVTRDMQL